MYSNQPPPSTRPGLSHEQTAALGDWAAGLAPAVREVVARYLGPAKIRAIGPHRLADSRMDAHKATALAGVAPEVILAAGWTIRMDRDRLRAVLDSTDERLNGPVDKHGHV